ncbi:hypothetical protein CVT26_007187 [Gymnopilus dilepis]|uniref:Uncharacterized protein n=1 Tax=Gymnopilus dilepis TaxID=231916 RepID=A0A409W089_9AGAR|nr:hypothetical protein CVT26_007187 [Gymnopilus dilepis]
MCKLQAVINCKTSDIDYWRVYNQAFEGLEAPILTDTPDTLIARRHLLFKTTYHQQRIMPTFYFSVFSAAPVGETSAAGVQVQNAHEEVRHFHSFKRFEKALLRDKVEQAVITVRRKRRRQGRGTGVRRPGNRLHTRI